MAFEHVGVNCLVALGSGVTGQNIHKKLMQAVGGEFGLVELHISCAMCQCRARCEMGQVIPGCAALAAESDDPKANSSKEPDRSTKCHMQTPQK